LKQDGSVQSKRLPWLQQIATLALRHHNVFIRKSPSGLFEEVDVTSGDHAEFIRFRDGQGEDPHKVKLRPLSSRFTFDVNRA
jgi:hypothetical protein